MPLFLDNFGERNRKVFFTPELMLEYGQQNLSREEIAKKHNLHVQTVNKYLQKVSLREAYEKGKKSA